MEVNVLHMAPRCLYLLPDLAGPVPSQRSVVSFAAFLCLLFSWSTFFRQSLRAEAARAWMSEVYRAVKPDGRILRWTLQPIDKCSGGLCHEERGRAIRLEKERRRRQRKLSSVNQADAELSLSLMTGLYRWNPCPQHRWLALTYMLPALFFQSALNLFHKKKIMEPSFLLLLKTQLQNFKGCVQVLHFLMSFRGIFLFL